MSGAAVDLFWLPLGAGGHLVRWNGRVVEAVLARKEHRRPCDLYHAALEVRVDGRRVVIEQAPAWGSSVVHERGVVGEGPVGFSWLGRSRFFRYEVRRWPDGTIPDVAEAVASPQRAGSDPARARRLLDLVPACPRPTWGRDELRAGEMWNSNSVVSWLLAASGHDVGALRPPPGGRAPGWLAGATVGTARNLGARRPGGPSGS